MPVPSAHRIEFRKRADTLVEEIKRWIVAGEYGPGDRLPREPELVERFGVSKWTVREALKSLEVQGLVKVTTGPNGGATILEISERRAMQLLGSFFYFRPVSARDIYQVRCILEPELAESAVDGITDDHLKQLERLISEAHDGRNSRRQRQAELDFHNVIADAAPNAWLAFVCRFMIRILTELTVFRKLHSTPHRAFAADIRCYHEKLVSAFRARDKAQVRQLMTDHMRSAAEYMVRLEAEIDRGPLMQASEAAVGEIRGGS